MINPNHPDLICEAEMRRKAQEMVPQCRECGIWPIIKYEPGILQASCNCQTWATDQEDRMSLANRIARDLEKKIRKTD